MNENVDHFHPSKTELKEALIAIGSKLMKTHGPDDEITVRAGDVVTIMAGSMRVRLQNWTKEER